MCLENLPLSGLYGLSVSFISVNPGHSQGALQLLQPLPTLLGVFPPQGHKQVLASTRAQQLPAHSNSWQSTQKAGRKEANKLRECTLRPSIKVMESFGVPPML